MEEHLEGPGGLVSLLPPGARIDDAGELVVSGCRLTDLADTYGTPLYVVDEAALRAQARRFRQALSEGWADSQVFFASKAFPCTAGYRVMAEEGIGVDVAGGGELAMAIAGGVDPADIIMHGNAKTSVELRTAVEAGVGTIVIDNFDDIDRLEQIVTSEQGVLIRVIPGVRPDTHEAISTGQLGSKFGLSPADARTAIAKLEVSDRLRLDGLHMHIGSQIMTNEPFSRAIEILAGLGDFAVYDVGGGLGGRYTYLDDPPSPEEWVGAVVTAARRHLPAGSRLLIEPGRSMVARAGVTLYRVVSVKRGTPTFVAVDGGMADNLEVALYGQRFEASIVNRVGGGPTVDLVGRHCESGDRIIAGVALADPVPGDLVVVAATGAYCFTMANNYNGALRPALVFCRDGAAEVRVRRETIADLLRRDVVPT
jgi:diaminopimelate decarboxylase